MQSYHGDVYANGAIYTSLPFQKDLGVKKEIHLSSWSLILRSESALIFVTTNLLNHGKHMETLIAKPGGFDW